MYQKAFSSQRSVLRLKPRVCKLPATQAAALSNWPGGRELRNGGPDHQRRGGGGGRLALAGQWPAHWVFFQSQSAVCLRCCFVASLAALPAVLQRSCTINRKSLFPGKHACEPYNPSSHTARVPACRLYITRPSVFCHPAGHRTLA